MAGYDIAMVVLVLGATLHGAWRGMALQVAPIASLVLGAVVAYPLSAALAPWFGSQAPTNRLLAMLVTYLIVSLSVYLLARALREFIAQFKLQAFDHHLGFLFGAIKGVLIATVVTFFLVALSATARDTIAETHSGYAAAVVMDHLHGVMPPALHDRLHPFIHSLDHTYTGREDPHHDNEAHEHNQDHDHATSEPVSPSEDEPTREELEALLENELDAILDVVRRSVLDTVITK